MPSWPGLLARLGLRIGHLRRHLSVGRRTMRRTSLSVLMLLALASAARAQAPEDSTRDLTAIKSDLARTKADLEAVKGQLAQVLRLLSQRAAQGGAAPSGPVRASVANAPSLRGAAAGVQGTPGFVIGRTTAADTVEGTPIRGAQPVEKFRRIIEQWLAQQTPAANRDSQANHDPRR